MIRTNTPLPSGAELLGLTRLMYVSVSTLPPEAAEEQVLEIVANAINKNARLHITGALIFSGAHFAQALEGDAADVDGLMTEIMADDRHRQVTIVERVSRSGRRFTQWSLGYLGDATFVDRTVRGLMDAEAASAKLVLVDEVYAMMAEFTR